MPPNRLFRADLSLFVEQQHLYLLSALLVGGPLGVQGETAERILKVADSLMTNLGYSGSVMPTCPKPFKSEKQASITIYPTEADVATAVLKARHERPVEGTKLLDQQIEDPLARIAAYVHY